MTADGETDSSESVAYRRVGAGEKTTCAVTTGGALRCWGEGREPDERELPAGNNFVDVTLGKDNGCARREDGTLACWGWSGQSHRAEAAPTDVEFEQVDIATIGCGITTDDGLECWGADYITPAPEGTGFVDLSVANQRACALDADGRPTCWGTGTNPQSPPADATFQDIVSGNSSDCGLTREGRVICWGEDTSLTQTPPTETNVRAIDSGGGWTGCAVTDDQRVTCWGAGVPEHGLASDAPTSADDIVDFAVSPSKHACIIDGRRQIDCWGREVYGEVSDPGTD